MLHAELLWIWTQQRRCCTLNCCEYTRPFTVELVIVLPFMLLLGWMLPFTAVGICAAFHTAARVDAAPFAAVGVDVSLPLFCGRRMCCSSYYF